MKCLTKIKLRGNSGSFLRMNKLILRCFSDNGKVRREEILFYIMNDKYSVKPDKEFRISHTTLDGHDQMTNKIAPKKIIQYGKMKIFYLSFRKTQHH